MLINFFLVTCNYRAINKQHSLREVASSCVRITHAGLYVSVFLYSPLLIPYFKFNEDV